jgi:demethylmenaquinone methyltransferase/2-methoxy-6-polyprenyl-1,4-benzoquinol methylase
VPVATARTQHARALFAGIATEYRWMGAVWSFGQDGRWRRSLVSRVPTSARTVADVASGTGLVARRLAGATGRRRVVRIDPSEPMLRADPGEPGWPVLGRAEELPLADASVDALTFTYLLRYVDDPGAVMRELARVVRPGGVVACLEFGVPPNVAARRLWRSYTRRVMPTVGSVVSPAWRDTGRFLGPSIERFWDDHPLGEQLRWWRDAGLADVQVRAMSFGAGVVLWGTKR